ncbi:unnamed protein product, partial [marine sediment metagenome]
LCISANYMPLSGVCFCNCKDVTGGLKRRFMELDVDTIYTIVYFSDSMWFPFYEKMGLGKGIVSILSLI